MNLHPVLKCFIMECIDATKGIFNTLSLRHDRACSYVLTKLLTLDLPIWLPEVGGVAPPLCPAKAGA